MYNEAQADRLAALVRNTTDAVIIRNAEGRILSWNRGAAEIYGYSEREALKLNFRRLIPGASRGETAALLRMLERRKTVPSIETQRRTKDGRILEVVLTATRLARRKGAALEFATNERDISDSNRAKRKLQSLYKQVISAQEMERRRLARDLHDGIGQTLAGIKFRLESLSEQIPPRLKKTRKGIAHAADSLDQVISEIRRVSQNLLPSELDLGLKPALVALCRDFRERLGIPVVIRCSGAPKSIAPDLTLALFRIAQEALNNIGKHARATKATLSIRRSGRCIELNVSDNGRGYDTRSKSTTKRGMGLSSIRERVQLVGGTIDFVSGTGQGTRILVRAPIVHGGGGKR